MIGRVKVNKPLFLYGLLVCVLKVGFRNNGKIHHRMQGFSPSLIFIQVCDCVVAKQHSITTLIQSDFL